MLQEAVETYALTLGQQLGSLKRLGRTSARSVGEVRVGDILKGLRGVPLLFWEHSSLSPDGVVLRDGKTLSDLGCTVEELLWLFLTGRDAREEELQSLKKEMAGASAAMNNYLGEAKAVIDSLDSRKTPVMTQLCAALLAMHGPFSHKYGNDGDQKRTGWQRTLRDVLAIIVALPKISGYILERKYCSSSPPSFVNDEADSYSYSLSVTEEIICRLKGCSIGQCDDDIQEFINLYLVLHSDHGGGNASAHTARLVGSTQADPFLALSASLLALSGPLHGGANGDALQWLRGLQRHVEKKRQLRLDETAIVRSYTQQWLRAGRKVPGFGHAVLGRVDPRVDALLGFAYVHRRIFSSKGLAFLRVALPAVSSVLKEGGKVRAPFPNVDAASGMLLDSVLRDSSGSGVGGEGRDIEDEMVVDAGLLLFALGRSLGILTHLVLDKALGVPLERPNSLTLEQLRLRAKL